MTLTHLRLIHDGAQPGPELDEPLRFGLQDSQGAVHAGSVQPDGLLGFEVVLDVTRDEASRLVWRGLFAHGPVAKRFLYLSWKRPGVHEHPWGWRIKIPLSGLDGALVQQAQALGRRLEAEIIGRRPHTTEPVAWRAVE